MLQYLDDWRCVNTQAGSSEEVLEVLFVVKEAF